MCDMSSFRGADAFSRPTAEITNKNQGKFFSFRQIHVNKCPLQQSKPVTLRQVVLESTLNPTSRSPSPELTHVEAQHELRKETIAAFHEGDADRDDDDLLVPREKTKDEQEEEEEEYRDFLQREVGGDLNELVTLHDSEDAVKQEPEQGGALKKPKRKNKGAASNKSKEDENQEFLMKCGNLVFL